jgi:tryptophan synthase alpha chain
VNRLDEKLAGRRPLLACYLPVGDPLIPVELTEVYIDCGVDILELGMPSPAPYLDGEDVSASMARAIAAGNATAVLPGFTAIAQACPEGPACISMCYADFDADAALSACAYDGIDGLLMLGLDNRPDRVELKTAMRAREIRLIGLVSTHLAPAELIAAREGDGYLMLQAAGGVTGPRDTLDTDNRAKIGRVRAAGLTQPILLGFGIGTAEQSAEAIDMGADGVVIGSMCVRKALEGPDSLHDFLTSVRKRLDG